MGRGSLLEGRADLQKSTPPVTGDLLFNPFIQEVFTQRWHVLGTILGPGSVNKPRKPLPHEVSTLW